MRSKQRLRYMLSLLHDSFCFDAEIVNLLRIFGAYLGRAHPACSDITSRSDGDMIRSIISLVSHRTPAIGPMVARSLFMAFFNVGNANSKDSISRWALENAFLLLFFRQIHLLRLPLFLLINQCNSFNVSVRRFRCIPLSSALRALFRGGGVKKTVLANAQHFLNIFVLNGGTCSLAYAARCLPDSINMKPLVPAQFHLLAEAQAVAGCKLTGVQSSMFTEMAKRALDTTKLFRESVRGLAEIMKRMMYAHGISFHACVYEVLTRICCRSDVQHDNHLNFLKDAVQEITHAHHLCDSRQATLHYFASTPASVSLSCLTSKDIIQTLILSTQHLPSDFVKRALHQSRLVLGRLAAGDRNTDTKSYNAICATLLHVFDRNRHNILDAVADACGVLQLSFAACSTRRVYEKTSQLNISKSLEECTQAMHLATWLMDTHTRCLATLERVHQRLEHDRDHSTCLRILETAVFVWLKQATTHGSTDKFQLHEITTRALGSPRITARLGHVSSGDKLKSNLLVCLVYY